MPETQYPKNPNTDTAFVTDDQGKRTRAVKTVVLDGTIDYPKNSNSPDCYVTVDGKKQRALMTADISSEGTVEYPINSNSTKGYVTVDGKKQRVVLTASLVGGGSAPVIEELNVTPSTSAQVITPPEGTDGYSPVNVAAVTSSIDANITAGNIKKDVQILGVTGSYEGTTGPAYYLEKTNDNGVLKSTNKMIDLTGITAIGDYALFGAYRGQTQLTGNINLNSITAVGSYGLTYAFANSAISSVNFSRLVTITSTSSITKESALDNTFREVTTLTSLDLSSLFIVSAKYAARSLCYNCSNLTTVDLSSLRDVYGYYAMAYAFQKCTALTSINLNALYRIEGESADDSGANVGHTVESMFSGCSQLANVNIDNLYSIGYSNNIADIARYMFSTCTALTVVKFKSLRNIGPENGNPPAMTAYMFNNCTGLTDLYFPALRNIKGLATTTLYGCTNVKVHLPANKSTAFASLVFGGTNTQLVFDQPSLIVLNSTHESLGYWRAPAKDTQTALAWHHFWGTTFFYTSGTADPQVGDTIYSDAACTTSVATVTAIYDD